ncbi:MAG: DNA repair protein RadC [Selenomonadaceae bacterium]|nr:DNA repair protein RadC [Selenomonadaceae bacterium]
MVRDIPKEDRPREKLIGRGAAALSDTELLAILLRTGTSSVSVLHLAEEVLAKYRDKGLVAIMNMSPQEIATVHGVGLAKAATIVAAVELGRRLSTRAAQKTEKIEGPEDAARYMMPMLRYEQKEHFLVMLLDVRNRVIATSTISVGGLTSSIAHPREVFREAIRHSAAALILVHNHPSGDPSPSREDIQLTRQMMKAGDVMGIPVLDHIILANDDFLSIKEANCL